MPHKCHSFAKHRSFPCPNTSIAPLLVAPHNRVAMILNMQSTEAGSLLWRKLSPSTCSQEQNTVMDLWKPRAWWVVLDTWSFGMERHSVPLPSVSQWENSIEYLEPSLSQLYFDESMGIFICFSLVMTPHWSNYRVPFPEKYLVTAVPNTFQWSCTPLSPS